MTVYVNTFPGNVCLLILCLITKGSTCPSALPTFKYVSETHKDVVLVNTSSSSLTTWSLTIRGVRSDPQTTINVSYFRNFFTLVDDNVTFVVNLSKELDLEHMYQELSVVIQIVSLQLPCKDVGQPQTSYDVDIAISPVNEFSPTFEFEPYEVNNPESTTVGTTVYSFTNITDGDIPPDSLEYAIRHWSDYKVDASHFLSLPNGRMPDIELSSEVDFDHLTINSLPTTYFLLIEVNDDLHTSMTTLTVHITDVDDLPPTFLPPCTTPNCTVQYAVDTTADYKGSLSVTPQRIAARDQDTLNHSISFSIDSSSYSSGFTIDPRSGVLRKTKTVTKTGILKIRAREEQGLKHSAEAIVLINIIVSNSATSTVLTLLSADKDDTFTYVTVAISVILVIVIAAFMVFVAKAKRIFKSSRAESEDSNVPNTSLETLSHSDGTGVKDSTETYEILVGVNPLYDTPNGRDNHLPPSSSHEPKVDEWGKYQDISGEVCRNGT